MKTPMQFAALISLLASFSAPHAQAEQQQQQRQLPQQQQQCQQDQQQQWDDRDVAVSEYTQYEEKYRVREVRETVHLAPREVAYVDMPGTDSYCKPNRLRVVCFQYSECAPCSQCQQQQFPSPSSGYDSQGQQFTVLAPGASVFVVDKVYSCAPSQQRQMVVCR